jgi:hypothetical protein
VALTSAELTARIQSEFETAWLEIKGTPPPPPAPDLEVLLTAVARGVLGYLKDQEDELITRLDVTDQGQQKSLTSVDATLGIGA